ncbi:MAG: C10 family peptidase, partial [Bacteroidales bacterium]|nr:C10 family peptidase [Bacteroidales bacterium]
MYKKIITTFVALAIVGLAAVASPIKMHTARSIAVKTFLAHGGSVADTSFVEMGRAAGFSNFYIFASTTGRGFVVVSADDCARRVLAVSTTSAFSLPMPENVQDWLQGYESQIAFLKAAPSKKRGTLLQGVADPDYWTVGPLLTTEWGQSPVYNDMCPVIEENHCKAGCVATAMSQIMRYWGYPQQGTGSHSYTHESLGSISANFETTYDWANMPN